MNTQKHIENIVLHIKNFVKIKILVLGVLAIIGMIIGFSLYASSLQMDSLFYMQLLGKYSFYICAVFSIISFMYLTYAKRNDLDETLFVMNNHYKSYSIILLIGLGLFINIVIFLMMLMVLNQNQSMNQLLSTYLPSFMLNIFCPLFICLFISTLISQITNFNKSGILLIGFLVLISPLLNISIGQEMISKIISIILQPFHFLYQADEYSIDYLYGLKDELFRWFVIIFYISCLAGTILFAKFKNKKMKISILMICILLGLTSLGYSLKPQSLLRVENSESDVRGCVFGKDKTMYQDYQSVNYTFNDYQLDINIDEELHVKGEMTLKSTKPQTKFVFTLYKGYKIQDISSQEKLKYSRNEDIVTIEFEKAISEAQCYISYSGYHPAFYSNNQAVALPGYLTWYPMAGEHQTFYNTEMFGYGYNPYNKIAPTQISLTIHTNYPIITNLPEMSENYYQGKSDSITLFGGYIEKENGQFVNVFPNEITPKWTKDDILKGKEEEYERCLKLMGVYGIDKKLIQNKKIITQPKSLTRFTDTNTVIIFDDYIIAKDGFVTFENLRNYLFGKVGSNSALVLNLTSLGSREDTTGIKDEYLDMLESDRSHQEVKNRLDKIFKDMSDNQFIKEFYGYALGETEYKNDEAFVKAMEAKYD